jgi:NhaP-type Na+/H+ or K+/H+ antiporter
MFTTGFAVFIGVVLLLIKLPRRTMLRALHHDLMIDIAVTLVVCAVHFGTFSGLMAATIAGLLTSIATSVAKRLFGYIEGKHYHPGVFCLDLSQ